MSDLSSFESNPQFAAAVRRRWRIQSAVANSLRGRLRPGENDRTVLAGLEIPSGNGAASARGLAGMYAPLAICGSRVDQGLVSPEQLIQMIATESASACDAVYFQPTRHSAGFMKSPYACAGTRSWEGSLCPSKRLGSRNGRRRRVCGSERRRGVWLRTRQPSGPR